MVFPQVNLLAVIVGAIITMILGAMWYSPMLFGNTWLRLIGKTMEQMRANSVATVYLFTFLGYLVMSFVLNAAVKAFGATTFVDGALIGGILWLGFVAVSTFTYTSFEGPSKGVWAIYNGYQFVAFLIMGVLFALWK